MDYLRLSRRGAGTRSGSVVRAPQQAADRRRGRAVAKELTNRSEFDAVDIGVLITQITDELPAPEDLERVRNRLAAKGWPLDDPRDAEETE